MVLAMAANRDAVAVVQVGRAPASRGASGSAIAEAGVIPGTATGRRRPRPNLRPLVLSHDHHPALCRRALDRRLIQRLVVEGRGTPMSTRSFFSSKGASSAWS
jgi:hypothetical protein